MTPTNTPTSLDETTMGTLIAEISKFGGSNKEDASRLARILLPHIEAYLAQKIKEARVDELMHVTCHKHGRGADNCRQIQDRLKELEK